MGNRETAEAMRERARMSLERDRHSAVDILQQITDGCSVRDAEDCVEAIAQYVIRKLTGTNLQGDVPIADTRATPPKTELQLKLIAAALPGEFTARYCPTWTQRMTLVSNVFDAARAVEGLA